MRSLTRIFLASTCALGTMGVALPTLADTGADVVQNVCTACHTADDSGKLARIDAVRKTPEAWEMTVTRMMRNHGVALDDDEYRAVVRHLSDTRGLTPAETEGFRYILEREPVAWDEGPNELMTQTCARCHSYARVALQRRTPQDWEHLINFHLGQFPTLEYQALARDRDWWAIAQTEVLDFLSTNYPLGETPAAYQGDLSGNYVVAGRQPGRGDYSGTMVLTAAEAGYDAEMTLNFADGTQVFKGKGLVMGPGEWRATLSDGQTDIRQVFAIAEDGSLSGRWHETNRDVIGGRLTAARDDAAARILAASPARLRTGEATEVRLTGTGLSGNPTLPEGATAEVVSASPTEMVLKITPSATPGPLKLAVGDQSVDLVAFATPDRITVVPERTMSRVGGNGGPIPKVPAQFEAMGWLNGPDGQPGTDDDIPLGYFPASWAIDNFNEEAARMEDAKFAGSINDTGLFTPGDAGPNPERPMSTNNAGNLKVIATVQDGGETLTAEAQLYATVQRFIDAPIR